MARYIDADELLRDIYRNPEEDSGERCAQILEAILSAHTADVAPRAELAREIFEEIERFLKNQEAISENKRLKEVGDWIFHDYLPTQLAELKKKYTQPEPPEGD